MNMMWHGFAEKKNAIHRERRDAEKRDARGTGLKCKHLFYFFALECSSLQMPHTHTHKDQMVKLHYAGLLKNKNDVLRWLL